MRGKTPYIRDGLGARRLHGSARANWKKRDNEIIEILATGERKIRFVPTPAKATPKAVETLCRNYREASADDRLPALLVIASFAFDFSCIHPFRDGNGRVSRLVTTLLLQNHGFEVARYISLERLVEESKAWYYGVLAECSRGWHEGTNTIVPWWNYLLGIVHRAYTDLERRVASAEARPGKSQLVRETVLMQVEPFTLADLAAQVPVASPQLIKKVLAGMKEEDRVRLVGRGRGARWEVGSSKAMGEGGRLFP